MVAALNGHKKDKSEFQYVPLWVGPSRLTTIRIAKVKPFDSLLKPTFKEPTGFKKKPQEGRVHLGRMGFENDEHAFVPHQIPERAVLQYNPNHYPVWQKFLNEIKVAANSQRDALMDVGGFGENIAVENSPNTPPMDESTVCIGDLVSFQDVDGAERARIRVTGFRMPCFKLNHRFGVPNMSKRTQDSGRTGWLYAVEKEGHIEVGDQMVLVERPFPDWPVSRIQYYSFKEPRNMEMAKLVLDTLGTYLTPDIFGLFEDRLAKKTEDMSLRLQGDQPHDKVTEFRLSAKIRQTDRVSEFVFERVKMIPTDSKHFETAMSGSHIRLRLKVNGRDIIRPYSVISGDSNRFSLGVALADRSRGGSAFMHNNLKVNDVLLASETFANTFPLASEHVNKHIFLAGGIGITAFLDHMRQCLATNQAFHLHYMIRNEADYAFKTQIDEMLATTNADTDSAKVTVYTSATGRRCNIKTLLDSVTTDEQTHIYICGSERMSSDIQATAQSLNISSVRIHQEQFSIDVSGDPFIAETSQTGKKFDVNNRQSLLDALRDAGLEVSSSCEAGNCGTCRIRVKRGRVLHRGTGLLEDEKAGYGGKEEGEMLACVSRGVGTITVEL